MAMMEYDEGGGSFHTPVLPIIVPQLTFQQQLTSKMANDLSRRRRVMGPRRTSIGPGYATQEMVNEWNRAQQELTSRFEEMKKKRDENLAKYNTTTWDLPGVDTLDPPKESGAAPVLYEASRQRVQAKFRGVEDPSHRQVDPSLVQWREERRKWLEAASRGETPTDPGNDGDFTGTGGGGNGQTSTSMGISGATGFPFFIVGHGKDKTMEKAPKYLTTLVREAMSDPLKAGELMVSMAALGAYAGGSEKYVQDRLYPVKGKDGQMTVVGRFTWDDRIALENAMKILSADQAGAADAVLERGGSIEEIPGFEELLAQRGLERQNMAAVLEPAGNSSGGGGGGGYRGGGGGGGYGGGGGRPSADVEQLKATVDGIARQRLGRVLTVPEAQEFANYFYSISGGGSYMDIESQAIAWIESRYRDEGAKQAQGQYVATLMKMMQGSSFLGGS